MRIKTILIFIICFFLVNSTQTVFAKNTLIEQTGQFSSISREKQKRDNYPQESNFSRYGLTSDEEDKTAFPPTEPITLDNVSKISKVGQLLKAPVFAIRFVPQENLMILGTAGGIYLYDATTYEVKEFYEFPRLQSLEVSADGKSIALGTQFRDKEVLILSIPDLQTIRTIASNFPDTGKSKIFNTTGSLSANGKIVAVAEKETTLYDTETGESIGQLKTQRQNDSYSKFSHDDNYLTTYGYNFLNLWKMPEKKWIATIADQFSFTSVAYSSDGKYLAAGSDSGKILVIDPGTGKIFTSKRSKGGISSLQFSNDDKYLLTGSTDKTAWLWDTSNWSLVHEFKMAASVYSIAFSPDNSMIITASSMKEEEEQQLIFWNVSDFSVNKIISGFTGPSYGLNYRYTFIRSIAFSNDNKYFASLSQDKIARVWETISGKNIVNIKFGNYENEYSTILFSPDNKTLFVGNEIFSFPDGKLIRKLPYQVRKSALSKDGNLFVSFDTVGEVHNQIRVWDIQKNKLIKSIPVSGGMYALGLSNDSTLVAIDNRDNGSVEFRNNTQIIDINTGKVKYKFKSGYMLASIIFDPTDSLVFEGNMGGVGYEYLLRGDVIKSYAMDGFDGSEWRGESKMRISPNYDYLIDGSHIFDFITMKEIRELPVDGRYVYDVAISSDNKYIATSTENGEIFIWGVKSE